MKINDYFGTQIYALISVLLYTAVITVLFSLRCCWTRFLYLHGLHCLLCLLCSLKSIFLFSCFLFRLFFFLLFFFEFEGWRLRQTQNRKDPKALCLLLSLGQGKPKYQYIYLYINTSQKCLFLDILFFQYQLPRKKSILSNRTLSLP